MSARGYPSTRVTVRCDDCEVEYDLACAHKCEPVTKYMRGNRLISTAAFYVALIALVLAVFT